MEQTGFEPPDVVVAPVAVGETFIATTRGFREMRDAGWIPRMPTMVAAQAARANAVVRAFATGAAITPLKIGYTVAEGLAAGDPGRKGAWTLRLLRELGGLAGDAEDDAILAAQTKLARTEGIWAGPTGVATIAVLERLVRERRLDPEQTICAIVSETGLKTEAEAPSREARAFDEASLRTLVAERLRR
jgi:threonine synthase